MVAYPEAKVILTNRDVDQWLKSMNKTVFSAMNWPSLRFLQCFDPTIVKPYVTFLHNLFECWCGNDYGERSRQAYLDHYANVRRIVPKDNLLEFQIGDTYEPLCSFLGHEVPDEEYPKTNDVAGFIVLHKYMRNQAALKALRKVSFATAVAVALAGAAWYLRICGLIWPWW